MQFFKNPTWIDDFNFRFGTLNDVPPSVFDSINAKLDNVQSASPLVSVIISAWNEETNIIKCLASMASQVSEFPFEIIVVNNNSTDATEETLKLLHVKRLFQPIQGCGPARQLGQENAAGKYILLADADCIYPKVWVNEMTKQLMQDGVVCIYGRYSFIAESGIPRWKLFLHERLKDVIAEFRHFKRPYLNAYGISMGYVREYGLQVGYVMHKIWGDDGRLCFDLMQFGKVKQVKLDSARAWTGPRTLLRDGSFNKAIMVRIKKEVSRAFSMFKPHPHHDTKSSLND
ncbi:Glycosyl transferase family 2 [Cnuella takakiae]|uniref:Glycosyl transferase family 2 n=1 Tax=Cnuella takakiae TaxID=1302690 RepID=A0A1M5CK21_9BACT|nr:glycosyltransferase family A protein [Cnuella takakiae]OLY91857.1 glycosyl transferase [Cnuella takakiae]SHF55115.1 Glycosyl transferase family 2 [Cnuella takakiae]